MMYLRSRRGLRQLLIECHPTIMQMSLSVSRRLVADSATIVQPALYLNMTFVALQKSRS